MENIDRLAQWRQGKFLDYWDLLDSWCWEWFVTLTLKDCDSDPKAKRLLLNWIRQLCTEERIQVGCAYVYCENYGLGHIHASMLGRNANGEKTLSNVSRSKWQRRWPCNADIQIPKSNNDVAEYLALQLFKFKCSNYPEIEFYNIQLLNRIQAPAQ